MTKEEIEKLADEQMAIALKRLPEVFGDSSQTAKIHKCENNCGREIKPNTMSVFMLPESENFKVLFVCFHCCKQLYNIHNYSNKN